MFNVLVMASIKRRISFKQSRASNIGTIPQSQKCAITKGSQEDRHQVEMPPNKHREEKALQACFKYLSENLPPDDVAMEMNSRELLTKTEHDKYLSMKRAYGISDTTKSEYLLQCLGRREAGFLTQFCEILREIKQASYLVDDIIEGYKTASHQESNTLLSARDRLSKVSLSDPDLYAKGIQECTRCKILEQQNKKLENQCRQLKAQQELYQTTYLPIKHVSEIAQKQLLRAKTEGDKLKPLLPQLQVAVAQTTSHISAVQTSLQKLNELFIQDKDLGIPLDHSTRNNTISDGNIEECTSEVIRHQTSPATRSSQFIEGHQLETTEAITHQLSKGKRHSRSFSVGTGNTAVRMQRVASDAPRPVQVDVRDPELKSALQRRWERIEAMQRNE